MTSCQAARLPLLLLSTALSTILLLSLWGAGRSDDQTPAPHRIPGHRPCPDLCPSLGPRLQDLLPHTTGSQASPFSPAWRSSNNLRTNYSVVIGKVSPLSSDHPTLRAAYMKSGV